MGYCLNNSQQRPAIITSTWLEKGFEGQRVFTPAELESHKMRASLNIMLEPGDSHDGKLLLHVEHAEYDMDGVRPGTWSW